MALVFAKQMLKQSLLLKEKEASRSLLELSLCPQGTSVSELGWQPTLSSLFLL